MPINKKMMHKLEKEYGKLKGEKIYYAMEMEHMKKKTSAKKK